MKVMSKESTKSREGIESLSISYLGAATAVIELGGLRIMTDPSLSPAGEYASGPVTLTKNRESGYFDGLPDAVLLSHDQHADNLDPAGREMLAKVRTTFTTKAAARRLALAENGGIPTTSLIGLDPWEASTLTTPLGHEIKVTATPARHGPAGCEPILGDVVGFVLTDSASATDLVYVTGDTVYYSGVEEVAKRFDPQIILLFAGAARTRGPFHLTMDANDAVDTAALFANSQIIPIHHEGWMHFTQSQRDLEVAFQTLGIRDRLVPIGPSTTAEFTIDQATHLRKEVSK